MNKEKIDNLEVSTLDELLNKIGQVPSSFYTKIGEALTPEERMFILKNLENRSCLSCTNGSCTIESSDKVGNDSLGRPAGFQCLGWMNPEIIGRSKVLQIKDVRLLRP